MEATSAGQIGLDLVINKNGFDRQMVGIQGMAKKAGKALAAAFTTKKLIDFGKQCISLGSDLQEVQNVVDVTFPAMSSKVDKFAKKAAESFGLSETMAKKYTGTFGAMAKAFGFSEKAAYDMSTTLTGLAGDVASFYNISQDEAYTKLKSVFTGETETLKDLGVVMTQNALDAYAMANGYGKTTAAMTEAEKVSLRYAFVQNQLTAAAGDFARTSGSWANQVRILSLQFDSLRASIGQGLINVLTPVIRVINILISKIVTAAKAFASLTSIFNKDASSSAMKISNSYDTAAASAGNLGSAADTAGTKASKAASKASKAAEKAAKKMRTVMGFDQIDKLSDNSQTSSGGSGGSGGTGGVGSGGISGGSSGLDVSSDAGKNVSNLASVKIPKSLLESLERFKTAVKGLSSVISSGLKWGYENVLKPLGKWTISKLAPKLLDVLSGAIRVVTEVIKALAPMGKWLWDKFLSKIANFAGSAIIKFLDLFAKGLNTLADWIGKHPDLFQAFVGGITAAAVAFKAAKLPGMIQGIVRSFQPMGKMFTKISGIFMNFSKVIGFITSPLGIAVVAVGGLVAAGILLYKNWDKIKKSAFYKSITKIVKSFKDLYKQIKNNLHPIQDFKKNWEGIKDKKAKIEAEVKEKVEGAIAKLQEGWESIQDKAASLVAEAKEKASGAIESLKEKWESIQSKAASLVAEAKEKASGVLESLKEKWESIKDRAAALTAEAKEKASGALDKLKSGWESIKDREAALVAEAKEKVSGALDKVKSGWNTVANKTATLTAKAENAASKTISSIKSAWDVVKDRKAKLTATAINKNSKTLKAIKSGWNSISSKTETLTAKFKDVFTAPLKRAWNGIAKAINGAIRTVNKIPGVNIKGRLPMLASGGYVQKNTPQLAMIGDNRHQGEVVAPEDKLQSMALSAAQMASGSGNAEMIALLRKIVAILSALDLRVFLDGKDITEKVVKNINDKRRSTGKPVIII